MADSEGDQILAGAFHAIMDTADANILQIAKKEIGYEFLYIRDTFSERFQL